MGSPMKFFGTLREHFFNGISRHYLLYRNFSIPEFNDNNGFPYEVFRYSETTNFL